MGGISGLYWNWLEVQQDARDTAYNREAFMAHLKKEHERTTPKEMKLMNCKARWAHLSRVDSMSGKFSIDLYPQDDATIKALEAEGLKLAEDEEGKYIRAKRKEEMGAPAVFDANKNPFTGLIGNGSIVNAICKPFDYDYKGKKGRGLGLEKIQVVTLVKYSGSSEDFDDAPGKTDEEVF